MRWRLAVPAINHLSSVDAMISCTQNLIIWLDFLFVRCFRVLFYDLSYAVAWRDDVSMIGSNENCLLRRMNAFDRKVLFARFRPCASEAQFGTNHFPIIKIYFLLFHFQISFMRNAREARRVDRRREKTRQVLEALNSPRPLVSLFSHNRSRSQSRENCLAKVKLMWASRRNLCSALSCSVGIGLVHKLSLSN